MNFQHSLEQEQFRDSARIALSRAGPADPAAVLAELGAFGLTVEEALGGSGLGLVEAAILLQEAGRAGLRFPLAETVLLAGPIAASRPDTVEAVLAGKVTVSAATSGSLERNGRRLAGTLTIADPVGAAWLAAPLGEGEVALLPASLAGEGTPRTSIEPGERAVSMAVDLPGSSAWVVAVPEAATGLAVLRCAELLGAAEHCFDLAVGYLKDRTQFGQAIGANQALKHMAADAYLKLENVRVAVEYAAAAADAARGAPADAALRSEAACASAVMLAYVPRAAREVAEAAIQFHGGIGLTWEYALNRYLRRIVRLGTMLGSTARHRQVLLKEVFPTEPPSAVPHARRTA